MKACFVLALFLTAVRAMPTIQERITGGALANISQHPYMAAMLYSWDLVSYSQACAGTIISRSAILSVAHCYRGHDVNRWKVRIGSANANSGGTVHVIRQINLYPTNSATLDDDISVVRTNGAFMLVPGAVAAAPITGANYHLADNQPVFAAGWGATFVGGPPSQQLRHVQIWSVNQNLCVERYKEVGRVVTANMLCAGWLYVGGRDQCQGDNGGPLIHNGVIVGVSSWGLTCNSPYWPRVNTRVSRYSAWIQSVAAT